MAFTILNCLSIDVCIIEVLDTQGTLLFCYLGTSKKDDGYVLFQGDIRLKRSEMSLLFSKTKSKRTKRAVLKYFKGNRWPKNGLIYDLHPSLSSKYKI